MISRCRRSLQEIASATYQEKKLKFCLPPLHKFSACPIAHVHRNRIHIILLSAALLLLFDVATTTTRRAIVLSALFRKLQIVPSHPSLSSSYRTQRALQEEEEEEEEEV